MFLSVLYLVTIATLFSEGYSLCALRTKEAWHPGRGIVDGKATGDCCGVYVGVRVCNVCACTRILEIPVLGALSVSRETLWGLMLLYINKHLLLKGPG